MTRERMKFGVVPGPRGRHVVMSSKESDGGIVHGVWLVYTRGRDGIGSMQWLADFASRVIANRWCRQLNERAGVA